MYLCNTFGIILKATAMHNKLLIIILSTFTFAPILAQCCVEEPCCEECPPIVCDIPYTAFKPKRITTYEEENVPVYRRRCCCRIVPRYVTVVQRRLVHEYEYTTEVKNRVQPHRERYWTCQPYTAYRRECYYMPQWNCRERPAAQPPAPPVQP